MVLLAVIAPFAAVTSAVASASPGTGQAPGTGPGQASGTGPGQAPGTGPGTEPPGPAATPSRTGTTTLCRKYQHLATSGAVAIRNDWWSVSRMCIVNKGDGPNFTVTRVGKDYSPGLTYAFPNVFSGWEWGVRSRGTRLPRRVDRVADPVTSWYTAGSLSRGTVGNRAYDIWFTEGRKTNGQARGTELMIWLDANTGIGPHQDVRVDGRVWEIATWTAEYNHRSWHYVQFRLPPGHTTLHVRNLALEPFVRLTERYRLLSSHWWWESTQAGFEIWRGGLGLRTTYFSFRFRLARAAR